MPCPACGAVCPEGAKFCPECGARVAASIPAAEQRKTVTILFADVTGSTAMGEQLDPESMRRVLARFFDTARTVVEAHGGTVEKFIGDAVMAVFGIPVLHEDDALRAVRAAAELLSGLETLNDELERDHGVILQLRVGVNAGEVVTGTEERLATGDAVNVAARLEQAAAPGQVLLGEQVVKLAGPALRAAEVGPLALKGKTEPVPVYRLVAVDVSRVQVPARPAAAPLVGRTHELAILNEAFARVVRERACGLFTLLGAAGVGKTRLSEEFLAGLDATVVRGRCLSYGQGITYFPVVEVVKSLQRLDPGGEVARLLEQDPAVGAGLDALMGVVEAATSSSEIAWAVRKVLEAGAASGPLVVVIDDVHWGEPTLFDLIEHVTDLSRGAPLLLLCMARPELLDRRPGWGAGALNATSVLLEPLDEQETDSLMDSLLLSGGHLDDRLRQRVRTAAGGNPLFLEEMLALAVTSGGGDGSDLVVPPTIQALLAARLDQLQPTERRILERGSVEGQSFHRGAVRALTPEEPEIQARLVGLVRKDLVRPDRATLPGEDAFRFRHLLIRDAAYDGLSKSTRAELHERFAEWLEHTAGELVELDEILGYHLEQAVRYRSELGPLDDAARELAGRAARRLEAAGLRALDRGDNSAAMNLLERALDLLPAEELYVDLELEIVRAMCSVGRLEEAVDRAQGVARKAEAAGDPVGALEAWLVRACWLIQTDPQAGGPELEARVALARTAFAEVTDDVVLAYFWWAVAHIEHIACRFGAGFEAAVRALDHADKAGLRSFAADCRVMAAAAAAHGPLPAVAAIEWLSHAQQSMPYYHAWIELMRCMSLALIGELEEARAAYAQAFGAMVERGDQTGAALSRMSRWHIEAAAGNHAEAATVARQGCEELEQLGERGWLSTLACQLAQSLYLLGRYQEAEEWATRGAELGSEDDIATQALARQVLAKLAARRGEHDKARSMALEALALTESTESPVHRGDVLLDLAEVHHLCGEQAEAARMAQQAIEAYDRKGATALVHQVEQRLAEFVASS